MFNAHNDLRQIYIYHQLQNLLNATRAFPIVYPVLVTACARGDQLLFSTHLKTRYIAYFLENSGGLIFMIGVGNGSGAVRMSKSDTVLFV